MEYNKLVAVTGMSGLYELISSRADGGVVRSLEDKTTKFVSNRVHNFSHLESIEIFTVKENVNLAEVLTAMKKSKQALPDAKADNNAVKAYFEKVYPDMDFERVYISDMKKMVKWLEIIDKNNIEIKTPEAGSEDNGSDHIAEKKTNSADRSVAPKNSAVRSAPPKKINTPRKMA